MCVVLTQALYAGGIVGVNYRGIEQEVILHMVKTLTRNNVAKTINTQPHTYEKKENDEVSVHPRPLSRTKCDFIRVQDRLKRHNFHTISYVWVRIFAF